MLAAEEQVEELLVMGQRLAEGIDLARLEAIAGRPLEQILDAQALARLLEDGWLRLAGGRLTPTAAGRQRLNAILGALMIDPAAQAGSPSSAAELEAAAR
jgi:coproporphyrinogen III oxidase-like Fe-S oxidoreductase